MPTNRSLQNSLQCELPERFESFILLFVVAKKISPQKAKWCFKVMQKLKFCLKLKELFFSYI